MSRKRFQGIATLIFSIILIIIGILQIVLSDLFGSAGLLIMAGILILLMRHELKNKFLEIKE